MTEATGLPGFRARLTLKGTDDMQATLTVTTTIRTWGEIERALVESPRHERYGVWQMLSLTRDLIRSATKSFIP